MPATVIAANWKMNKTPGEAVDLARQVSRGLSPSGPAEVVLCPAAVSLESVRGAVAGTRLKVGAQNMHHEASGAFTGEVSPLMLRGLCDYVILGHSERRQLFGETDEMINRKVLAAVEYGLRPIFCVGETLEEREQGQAEAVVRRQLLNGLAGLVDIDSSGLVIAYEPVWAIGTGQAATPEIAQEIIGGVIRDSLRRNFSAADVPVLYGGSVNPGNIAACMSQPDIDGALVGGAALDPAQFLEIVRLAEAAG